MSKRNIIKIDLSGCKNWKECEKVIGLITSLEEDLQLGNYQSHPTIKAPLSN